MDDFAVVDDVQVRMMRDLSDAETIGAEALLSEVSAMMRLSVPDLDARIAADLNVAIVARGVAVSAVHRVMINPEAWSRVAIDDFSRARDAAASSGALYLSSAELGRLRGRQRVRSVRLVAYDDA